MKVYPSNRYPSSLWTGILMSLGIALTPAPAQAIGSEVELTGSLIQLAKLHAKDSREMIQSVDFLISSFDRALKSPSLPLTAKTKLLHAHLRVAKKGVEQNRDVMPAALAQFFIKRIDQMANDVTYVEFFTLNPSVPRSSELRKQAAQRLRSRVDWSMFIVSSIKPVVRFL